MASSAPSGMDAAGLLSTAARERAGRVCRRTRPRHSTGLLSEEHSVILRMLGCLERAADAMRTSRAVCDAEFVKILMLMNVLICRGHYLKERRLLTILRDKGHRPPAGLVEEHRDSMDFIAAMLKSLPGAANGERSATCMLTENAMACVGFMRAHIVREEKLVFPLADAILTEADGEDLAAAYCRVDLETGGPLCGEMADVIEESLARRLGAAREAAYSSATRIGRHH